jgi:NADPH-dependent 2,4-dienoyl-CoA reductase/sulfur reductase-like enzyme/rhodanese-related sulfurtransferase
MAGKGKRQKIVIVGGVACGPKAAARARRRDQEAEIIIFERGRYISYAGCGLPYYLAGAVKVLEGLMTTSSGDLRDPEFFHAVKDVTVRTGTLVEAVDPAQKQVRVKNLQSGESETVAYDQLVLATGASPVVPPFPGADLKNVFTLRRPEDAQGLLQLIEAGEADRVTIIGAGRIGLEVADAFGAQAVETTMVEMTDQVLPGMVDPDVARYVAGVLREEKVALRLLERVKEIRGDGEGKVAKVITDRGEIEADAVLVAVGVKPNVELARAAGLKLGETGAILVDEFMRTDDPNIFAGGDCVEVLHRISGRKVYAPLGSTANRQGRVIGDNLAAGREKFDGIVGTSVLRTLGINLARTGITEAEARASGFQPVVGIAPSVDRSHYMAGGRPILVKILADAGSGRVLGAQVVGPGDVVRRVDVIATALRFGATVDDLGALDLCYAPPFATAIEAVAHAGNIVRNKRSGLAEAVSVKEARELVAQDQAVWLDLRNPKEIESQKFGDEQVVRIPLPELRRRSRELPKDKEIICVCQIGVRAYEACRILKGQGFSRVKFLEGGVSWWSRMSA